MNKNYNIISHDLQIDAAIKHIEQHEFLAFDTETTGLNTRKDKVIGMSFSGEVGTAFYIARLTWCTEKEELIRGVSEENFVKMVEMIAHKELLMWNASFDCRIVESNFEIDLLPSLTADVLLMKHTVNEDAFFYLKRTAIEIQEHLGMDMEKAANEEQIIMKENIIKNGGSVTKECYEMFKADLDILGKYACADADLTLRIGHYYLDSLNIENLTDFFFDVEPMPLYKEVTVKMEKKGVALDLEYIKSSREEIQVDIEKLEEQVIISIMSTEEGIAWFKSKLAEIPPKAKGNFGQGIANLFKLDLPISEKTGKFSLSKKNLEALDDINSKDFLLTGDIEYLTPEIIEEVQREIYYAKNEDKEINISSKKQLGEVIFDYFEIKPLGLTDKGNPQFDDDFVQHLGTLDFEWARNLSNYNKLIKIRGTYMDRFLNNHEDGIYYPSFKQHGTISGRYGSDLQQLPRPKEEGELDEVVLKYNNRIRAFIIAGEGRIFIDDDYESLEPHVFAHVSGDDGLKDIFRKGHDFYSTIAIATEKMEGVSADKKADNYLGKVAKAVRQAAKAYCLGVPYGMTAYALGKTLGITTEEAEVLIDGYLGGFPELKKWMDDSKRQAQYNGFVRSEVGRVRHLPKVKELHAKHGEKLLDFKYRNKLIKKMSRSLGKDEAKKKVNDAYMDYKNGINNSRNFQIQSLGASIVNLAAIEINREFIKRGIDGWVALQIHDQLVMNVPEEKADECREFVQDIMENNYKLSIALKAPAELAHNLKDGH